MMYRTLLFFSSNIFYYSQFSFRLSICMNSIFYPHLFHIFCYPHFHLFTHYFAKYSNLFSDQFCIYFDFLKIVLDFAKKYHPFLFLLQFCVYSLEKCCWSYSYFLALLCHFSLFDNATRTVNVVFRQTSLFWCVRLCVQLWKINRKDLQYVLLVGTLLNNPLNHLNTAESEVGG